MKKVTVVLLLTLIVLGFSFTANAARPPLTAEFALPDYPFAAITGSQAVIRNPSALFVNQPMGLLYLHSFAEGSLSGDNGFVVATSGVGIAYQRFGLDYPNNVSRYDFAVSSRVYRNLYTGISYTLFSTDWNALDKAHFWNYSVTYHLHRAFSVAAQLQNINRNRFEGERSARGYAFSAALRPLEEKITLGGDLRIYGGQKLSDAEWRISAQANVREGLSVFAGIGNEQRFGFGVQMSFGDTYAGGESYFDESGSYDRSTVYIGTSVARRGSLLHSPAKVLHLDISGDIPEQAEQGFLFAKPTPTMYTRLARIEAAKDDPQIKGMLLTFHGPRIGWAKLTDLRQALFDFRATGKPIICRLGAGAGSGSYFLASVADSIFMAPVDGLYLIGLRAEIEFYAGTLEKLGIKPEIEKIGKYKNAPDRYTEKSLSPEHREAVEALLNDIYVELVTGIAKGRGMDPRKIANLIDEGPFSSAQADSVGLIDGLLYDGAFQERLHTIFPRDFELVSIADYHDQPEFRERFGQQPKIALIGVQGAIERSESGSLWFGSRSSGAGTIANAIHRAARDSDVKALVLRLDTPGGDAIASDIIWGEVTAARQRKPVVVSMSDACASGGYYIATAADRIFAEPATVTGSIGIYGGKADITGLHDKLGITSETITRGRHADFFSLTVPFSDEEREMLRFYLKQHYNHFLDLVAEGRRLRIDSVRVIAQGRVWSGLAALQNGLADDEGSVLNAVAAAAQMAGIKDNDYQVVEMPKTEWRLSLPGLSWVSLDELLPFNLRGLSDMAATVSAADDSGLRLEMPYHISIY